MKNRFKVMFVLIATFAIGITSCNIDREVKLRSSSGKTCELLIVINDVHWETQLGDSITAFLGRSQYGLPQDEPLYDIVHIQQPIFTDLPQSHRNILIFDVDEKYTSPKIQVKKDVWSQPQIVAHIKSPDRQGLIDIFEENKYALDDLYEQSEYNRIHLAYKKIPGTAIQKKLKEKFNLDLIISKDFTIAAEHNDFIWLKRSIRKADQGIFIYKREYTDTNMLRPQFIHDYRDEITEKYIPGSLPASYMLIENRLPPEIRIVSINDSYAIESRGLWRVENDFMGGPFVNVALLDEKNQNIVFLDGYIYHPSKAKRDYLKQLEAVFRSAKFVKAE